MNATQKHSAFLNKCLQNIPHQKAEPSKTLLLYFIVTALLHLKQPIDKDTIIKYLTLLQVAPLQFKNSNISHAEPSIINSYCALAICKQFGLDLKFDLHQQPIDQSKSIAFVKSLINQDGSVRSSQSALEADLRMLYSAVAYLDFQDIFLQELADIFIEHILSCQNPDGAFGLRPNLESHAGATYCALASLKMLRYNYNNSTLIEWLCNRQCNLTGGFQGRINKIPDSCYSFWVGWSLAIQGHPHLIDHEAQNVFLSHCQSPYGGYSKYPDESPDPIHTLLSLFGQEYQQLEAKGSNKFEVVFAAPDTQNEQYSRYTLRSWWIVLQAHREKPFETRMDLYNRALQHIPNCYKLWFNYLKEEMEDLGGRSTYLSPRFEQMIDKFESALVYMHKMPNIWLMFADYTASLHKLSLTREIYDRALMSLPVTQHHRIWKRFCEWISTTDAVQSAKCLFKRYLKINPDYKEEYLDYLMSKGLFDEGCQMLVEILNDDQYSGNSGRTKYEFMKYLCEIIARHPETIKCIDAASIMKYGIKKYSDEIGQLWIKLADYYIKTAQFEQARDTFEDAVNNVLTVKDFSLVFNAYVKFEENSIQMLNDDEEDDDIDDTVLSSKLNKLLKIKECAPEDEIAVEDEVLLKLDRLEELLERRPLLLNSCLLRQNKYNVEEWLKRIQLVKGDERMALKTFTEALEIVEPTKVDNGKLSDIWVAYGKYYRDKGDYKMCNQILRKGTLIDYKTIDEYVNIWSSWVEMLLADGYVLDTITVIKQALFKKFLKKSEKMTPLEMVPFSLTLWQLYIDLESNFGTFKSLRAAYRRMVELKVVTPFVIINFASLLEDNAFYEESFKVFETGVSLFEWPALYDVWIIYITKFISRYRGQRIERTRNLFETVLEQVPKEKSKIFYLMYGEFEEQYGLLNHAIEIYDRMVFNVEYKDKLEAYNIYISKVAVYLGITKTRPVFESAIENLQEQDLIQMGLRLSQLERKFGEIDRARAVYIHISQFSDPRFDDFGLWKTWENFELHHGNEDTYKEFRRISKSVVAKFSLMPPDPQKIKERVDKGQL